MGKQCFILFALLLTLAKGGKACHTRHCRCVKDVGSFVAAKCSISAIEDIKRYIQTPHSVTSLDLSSNQITALPPGGFTGFSNIINLSLADNQITVLENHSLEGLTRLRFLNLTKNKLVKWRGNISLENPHLRVIDITDNNWLPSNNILKSVSLVKGSYWNKQCTECTLERNFSHPSLQNLKDGEFIRGNKGECRAVKYLVSRKLQLVSRHGFYSSCFRSDTQCYSSLVTSVPVHHCWEMDNYILNIEFLLGPIALVLNIIVIINTITTPKLRANVAMILVCNIAISDAILSLYSILITSLRKISYVKFYDIMDSICPCLGFMWLMAQCVTTLTLLFLTIERYLAIVYCMSPSVRMRQKHAIRCAISSWVTAVMVAMLPLVGIGVYTTNTYCIPLYRKKNVPHMYGLSVGLTLGSAFLYLVNVPLYLRIYCFVKHNGLEGFNRADSSVARKIATLVMCNMFFFCLPVLIGLFWVSFHFTKGLDPIVKEIITGVIPTLAFTLNCSINPLLYAYRNKSFVDALRNRLELLRTKARAWSVSNMTSIPPKTEDANSNKL